MRQHAAVNIVRTHHPGLRRGERNERTAGGNIIEIVEAVLVEEISNGIVMANGREQALVKWPLLISELIVPDIRPVELNVDAPEQVGRHLFEPVNARNGHILAAGVAVDIPVAAEQHGIPPFRAIGSSVGDLAEIELYPHHRTSTHPRVVHFDVDIMNKVAVQVEGHPQSPVSDIARGVAKRARGVDSRGRITAVKISCPRLIRHLPPIGLRAVAMPDDPGERAFHPREELLFPSSGRQIASVRHGTELPAIHRIGLRFILCVKTGNTPASLDADGSHGEVPTHPKPAVPTTTVITDRQLRLHSVPAPPDLYRISQLRSPPRTPFLRGDHFPAPTGSPPFISPSTLR